MIIGFVHTKKIRWNVYFLERVELHIYMKERYTYERE